MASNRITRTALALAIFAGAGIVRADPPRENETLAVGEVGKRLVEFAQRSEALGFSGAMLAAKDGKVIAAVGVGFADLEEMTPNTPATLFEIASATKQFTAAAVMNLVEDGKLNLDDSIAMHLPGVPENCHDITIEHLLRHTSGIPGSNSQGRGDDIEKVLPSFLHGGPRHEPGTHWEYWNQGYAILSEIIRRAAEDDYTTYCEKALFAPANMNATCFTGDDAPEGAIVAIGRSARGEPRSALEHPYGSYGFQYRGMGGAVASVRDLWRWDRALYGDAILGEEAKAQLFKAGLNDYALGWFVRTNAQGRLVQSHGGGVRGFICEMRRYPDEDVFLVVLCNRDDAPLRRMMPALETILLGDGNDAAANDVGLKPLDETLAADLEGRYQDDRGAMLMIERDIAAVRASIHWSPPSGPVTRAVLGRNEAGDVVLDDGSDQIPITIERDGGSVDDDDDAGDVRSISFLGRTFTRSD